MKTSSKSSQTKEEKEIAKKKKSFESKELNKHYFDSSPFKISKGDLTLKQLRYGALVSHNLEAVIIELDTIRLKSSWTEFILIMLSQLIETDKNFKETLGKIGITNQNFYVEKIYGNYSFDKQAYTVYKIFDTDYYLEVRANERVLFNAMVGLIIALDINPKSIKFRIINKNITKEDIVKSSISYQVENVSLEDARERIENGESISYIKIDDEVQKVNILEVALVAMCNFMYNTYGMNKIMSIPNDKETGICLGTNNTEFPTARIQNSMLSVYTSGNYNSILNFMENSMDTLGVKIYFGFKAHNQVKHEWEVD